jgi:hypothetical protein
LKIKGDKMISKLLSKAVLSVAIAAILVTGYIANVSAASMDENVKSLAVIPAGAQVCRWDEVTSRAKNLFGGELFSFTQTVHWCYDKANKKVTVIDYDKGKYSTNGWAWSWAGEGSRTYYKAPSGNYVITGRTGAFKNNLSISITISTAKSGGATFTVNPGGTATVGTKMYLYWYGSAALYTE